MFENNHKVLYLLSAIQGKPVLSRISADAPIHHLLGLNHHPKHDGDASALPIEMMSNEAERP